MYKNFYNLTRSPFDLTPDPILSAARGEYIARRGYSLYWVHTEAVSERFMDDQLTWAARTMGRMPMPPRLCSRGSLRR